MSANRFPIRDIPFHEDGLRETAEAGPAFTEDEGKAIAWHSTALAYLHYGAAKGLNGPAVETASGPVLIEDYLIPALDSHGLTYFKHVAKADVI